MNILIQLESQLYLFIVVTYLHFRYSFINFFLLNRDVEITIWFYKNFRFTSNGVAVIVSALLFL